MIFCKEENMNVGMYGNQDTVDLFALPGPDLIENKRLCFLLNFGRLYCINTL